MSTGPPSQRCPRLERAGGEAGDAEGDHILAPQSHQPADRAREAQVPVSPAHVLGEVHVADDLQAQFWEQRGGSPALAPRHVVDEAPSRLFPHLQVGRAHAFGAGEALDGLGGAAFGVEGRFDGRSALHDLPGHLFSGHVGDTHGDAARRYPHPHVLGLHLDAFCGEHPRHPGGQQVDGRPAGGSRHLFRADLYQEVAVPPIVRRDPVRPRELGGRGDG